MLFVVNANHADAVTANVRYILSYIDVSISAPCLMHPPYCRGHKAMLQFFCLSVCPSVCMSLILILSLSRWQYVQYLAYE